jgi:hypothetical protein
MSVPSSRTTPLTVYAPASIGNLSVGFDALGLALAPMNGKLLGDLVQIQAFAEEASVGDWRLEVDGPFAKALPDDPEDNIVIRCCRAYAEAAGEWGIEVNPLRVRLSKRLPIGSGLGSSASSIVAALEALNRWHGNLLNTHELFRLMAQMEGTISGEVHLDNVAPCLYGGLRLCPPASQSEYALPWPGAWRAGRAPSSSHARPARSFPTRSRGVPRCGTPRSSRSSSMPCIPAIRPWRRVALWTISRSLTDASFCPDSTRPGKPCRSWVHWP